MMTTDCLVRPDTSEVGPGVVRWNGLVAEQLLGLLEDAAHRRADAECYECYEPVTLVFVGLEPAATSPFMDG